MTWTDATEAVRTRFEAVWTETPLTQVAWENEYFDIPDVEWLYVEILGTNSSIVGYGGVGTNLIRRNGMVMIHVFVPLNSGGSRATELAEKASKVFGVKSFSGVQFWAPYPPSPPNASTELGNRAVNGSWWRSYSSVPFQFDEVM
jgi:hypothetical protein